MKEKGLIAKSDQALFPHFRPIGQICSRKTQYTVLDSMINYYIRCFFSLFP